MVHDGNKDEAEKCFNLAQKYFQEGNRDKAIKFTQKAERLYPTQKSQGRCTASRGNHRLWLPNLRLASQVNSYKNIGVYIFYVHI